MYVHRTWLPGWLHQGKTWQHREWRAGGELLFGDSFWLTWSWDPWAAECCSSQAAVKSLGVWVTMEITASDSWEGCNERQRYPSSQCPSPHQNTSTWLLLRLSFSNIWAPRLGVWLNHKGKKPSPTKKRGEGNPQWHPAFEHFAKPCTFSEA